MYKKKCLKLELKQSILPWLLLYPREAKWQFIFETENAVFKHKLCFCLVLKGYNRLSGKQWRHCVCVILWKWNLRAERRQRDYPPVQQSRGNLLKPWALLTLPQIASTVGSPNQQLQVLCFPILPVLSGYLPSPLTTPTILQPTGSVEIVQPIRTMAIITEDGGKEEAGGSERPSEEGPDEEEEEEGVEEVEEAVEQDSPLKVTLS